MLRSSNFVCDGYRIRLGHQAGPSGKWWLMGRMALTREPRQGTREQSCANPDGGSTIQIPMVELSPPESFVWCS